MENIDFDFNGVVNGIRSRKLSNVVPLMDYLTNEYIKSIISQLKEMRIQPGEKYVFDNKIIDEMGKNGSFTGMTHLCSEKPFTDMDYTPLKIDGLYYGIWLTLNVQDCTDREEPCVLLSGNTLYYAEKVYNYFILRNR